MSIDNNELDNIIVMNDEDGNEMRFEFLDLIQFEGNEYVVLLPADDEDAEEVVIMKFDDPDSDDPEETFSSVEDERTLNAVFAIFKERFKDLLNFVN